MRKKSFAILLIIFGVILIGKNALAQQFMSSYKFLKGIKKVYLVAEGLEGTKEIGLTVERLSTVTELRLRKEGIEILERLSYPMLCITVHVVGPAFYVGLSLREPVYVARLSSLLSEGKPEEISYIACRLSDMVVDGKTWEHGVIGTHGNDPDYIISALNRVIDKFLNDYYKANPKR